MAHNLPRVHDRSGKWLGIRSTIADPAWRHGPQEDVQVTMGGPKGGIYANINPSRAELIRFARDVLTYFGETEVSDG